jgi:HrpA-like RNA helicase
MSATMNAEIFKDYFGKCPLLEISGRTFPVQTLYLEDAIDHSGYTLDINNEYAKKNKPKTINYERVYANNSQMTRRVLSMIDETKINYDLIFKLLVHIAQTDADNGAVLIFLPGIQEITTLYNILTTETPFREKTKYTIVPLHSTLSSENQQLVFKRPKPNVRKIVISTNIAETSVTIDDVTIVIDSGKMKEMQYDNTKSMSYLKEMWVSKANAKQRAGRAGRVQAGKCYHLFTKQRHNELLQDQVPEIKRVSLEQLCLRIKVLGLGDAQDVLRKAIEPPEQKQVTSALATLRSLHALEAGSENLTALGYHLAALPVDIRMGKMIIYGAMFKCLDPVLTIAASMGFQSPLISPIDAREEANMAHKKLSIEKSDHLTVLECYKGWKQARQKKE